jgi:hypothetical protein
MSPRTGVAPTWAAWARGNRNVPGPLQGASLAGIQFLPEELGPNARIVVEIAWGADPNGDESVWSWTDITTDVYQEPAISFGYGRADEASTTQPAQGSLTLDNSLAEYSLGGISPNWPNVKENVPIRIQIDPNGTGFQVVFQGNVVGFTPEWDITGAVPTARAKFSGVLRRLGQGKSPLVSPIKRNILQQVSSVVAYWPCEVGQFATTFESAVDGPPLLISGTPRLNSNIDFVSSNPLPVLKGSVWSSYVPAYTPSGLTQLRFLIEFPSADELTDSTIVKITTSGSANTFFMTYKTGSGGKLNMDVYDRSGVLITSTGGAPFDIQVSPRTRRFSVELQESGGSVLCRMVTLTDNTSDPYKFLDSAPMVGYDVGSILKVDFNPSAQLQEVALGHIVIQNTLTDQYADDIALAGNTNESDTRRFRRLCDESAVPYRQLPSPPSMITTYTLMGPQKSTNLLELIRDAELAGQGIVYDGTSNGLTYIAKQYRENQIASLTVDVSSQELSPPFNPTPDDQRRANSAVVTRTFGAKAVYEDTDGPLGSVAIGLYDTSETVNLYSDSQAQNFAAWMVHLGTVEGYRYPSVTVNLRENPQFALLVLGMGPGSRIDLTNLQSVLPQHPVDSVSLVVEGVNMQISPTNWIITFQCSSFAPWRIAIIANETGDTSEFLLRPDTDGSQTTLEAVAGSVSLSVSSSGAAWTTAADDFPFDVSVAGIQVTVTNVTGASSPQTLTVEPTSHALPANSPVELWTPTILGL